MKKWISRLTILCSFFMLWVPDVLSAERVLDRIPEIKALSPTEADEQRPVLIEAQVLHVGPIGSSLFVYKNGSGLYIHLGPYPENEGKFSQGDWVRIEGVTVAGEFYPSVNGLNVEIIGSEALPEPRPFRLSEIHMPSSDCDWVSIEGRLTALHSEAQQHGRVMLIIELDESIEIGVQLIVTDAIWNPLSRFMFHRVRLNAVVGTVYNTQRQLTGRILLLNSIDDIQLLEEKRSREDLQLQPIHMLMRVGVDHQKAVRTQGRVTYASPTELFLRGEEACLKVAVLNGDAVDTGQLVELEGFVWPQLISPAFRARQVRVLEQCEGAPEPVDITLKELLGTGRPEDLLDPRMNYELVRIRAQIVDIGKSFGLSPDAPGTTGQQSLLCRAGGHLFEARLPVGMEMGSQLQPGAVLDLTGICNLMANKQQQWRLYFEGLWLQVRSAGDLVVVQPAPWWTPKRLIWISATILVVALLFMVWVAMLHKVVDRQTDIIGEKIERETILDERQRIARELHDNLEQGLTGTAIQLQGNRKLLQTNLEKWTDSLKQVIGLAGQADAGLEKQLKGHLETVQQDTLQELDGLETVQDMLAYCGEESRTSILDLRGGLLERMDLVAALKEALSPLARECNAQLAVEVTGTPRRLKQVAERNLLMIAKEAASNAARHSRPNVIHLKLVYSPAALSLSIEDDGCGFVVDQLPNAGRFGLQGMEERINRLGGRIKIDSKPDEGTLIEAVLSSTDEWELKQA